MIFRDRTHAGEELAKKLLKYKGALNAVILALPRGGVAVGAEIARRLNLPLDIVVPRKIGAPGNPEYAIGAITETGEGIMNEEEVKYVDKKWLQNEIEREKKEAERRIKTYRAGRPAKNIKNKTVIIVDDGVATGYTMRAAVSAVRTRGPKNLIIAVPHGARDSIKALRREADEVYTLDEPILYGAVGQYYVSFPQVSDEEVINLMSKFL